MRLTKHEISAIVSTFHEVFGSGSIYLFGSRVDDNKRGGEIDLYLSPEENYIDTSKRKFEFLTKLETLIGEQKIDVVFEVDASRVIESEAKKGSVELNIDKLRLEKYFKECSKHSQRIEEAYRDIEDILPLDAEKYIALTKDQVRAIDQYLYRFSKLQDILGDKIFRLILAQYEENIDSLTFIDILNKLEKYELIRSTHKWLELRKIRNELSHQYEDEPEEMSQTLNLIFKQKNNLIEILHRLKKEIFLDEYIHPPKNL